jgi:hypothetical protein
MKYNNMATDNKGIMVYLTPDLVDAIGQYCLDNGITRKIGGDEAAPSLGTGIAHYLKSTILNTVPLPPKNLVSTQEYNNNVGLSDEKITDLIKQYNNNIVLSEERITDLIQEYNNNSGLSEEKVTDLIEEKIATLPPTLSLQDIDRLIGSAISSITKTTADLENIIKHQGAEIDRLSKMVNELVAANIESLTPTAIQPLNADSLSWGDFCKMIDEPAPNERNKASGDKMVVLAESKGFNGWRYDGKTKKFTQPPNFSSP